MYKLFYTNRAKEDLKNLPKRIASRIRDKLLFYAERENIFKFAKPLGDFVPGIKLYRFRMGDYRAIFEIVSGGYVQVLMILRIKHRKDVYLK